MDRTLNDRWKLYSISIEKSVVTEKPMCKIHLENNRGRDAWFEISAERAQKYVDAIMPFLEDDMAELARELLPAPTINMKDIETKLKKNP